VKTDVSINTIAQYYGNAVFISSPRYLTVRWSNFYVALAVLLFDS